MTHKLDLYFVRFFLLSVIWSAAFPLTAVLESTVNDWLEWYRLCTAYWLLFLHLLDLTKAGEVNLFVFVLF
jgi:hypothetical protein